MKQRVFKFIMIFILFGFVVSLTYTFAWYTYTSKIGKIDADTKDIAFTYTFNNSNEINVNSYSISNLTFFDIDDSYELKYFNDMHTVIELDIENYSSDIIDYTIDFSTEISEIKDGENVISRAYVIGFITTSDNISITDNGSNSISNYVPENEDESVTTFLSTYKNDATNPLEISNGSNKNSSVTLYLHLLGVQEIDTANNDFLFDENGAAVSYEFTLTIKAVGRTKDPTINTTPSGTSTPATSGTTSTTLNGTSTPTTSTTSTTSGTTSTTPLTTSSTVAE